MAILDRPLFGDEVRGRVRNTVTLFKRAGNKVCTDPDPPERFHFSLKISPRQTNGGPRKAWKEKFREAVGQWFSLSGIEKLAYGPYCHGLETCYNAFLREKLGGVSVLPTFFDGIVFVGVVSDSIRLIAPAVPPDKVVVGYVYIPTQIQITVGGQIIGFSYSIP